MLGGGGKDNIGLTLHLLLLRDQSNLALQQMGLMTVTEAVAVG